VGRGDMRITLPGGALQVIDTNDNTADFVTVRVARNDGKHFVWRNDTLLNNSLNDADGYEWAPGTVGPTGLRTSFGIDGRYFSSTLSGTVDFDFIRMDPTGAYIVPEPSTFALSALGLLGLLACGRRRRR